MIYIIILILILISLFSLWCIWRLNLYVSSLEELVDELIAKIETQQESLRKAVRGDMINVNGELKKPLIETDE